MGFFEDLFTEQEVPTYTVGTGSPLSDPLLNYVTQYALMLMGQVPDVMTQQQTSPFAMAFARYLDQVPTDESDKRQILTDFNNILQAAQQEGGLTPELLERFSHGDTERMASALGMTLDDLVQSQLDWSGQQHERWAQAAEIAGFGQQGQYEATRRLYELMTGMPEVTQEGINALTGQTRERMVRDINLAVDEQARAALQQANAANYNPGRVLGDIEEARTLAVQNADLDSLTYALNLLGAQTNLGIAQGSALQSYLNYPTQLATQIAGIRESGANVPTQVYAQQYQPGMLSQIGTSLSDLGGGISSLTGGLMDLGSIFGAPMSGFLPGVLSF